MDLVLLELILWVGLLFFFWALKEGLGRVEADIESLGVANARRAYIAGSAASAWHPEKVAEPIGTYRDMPIFRYVMIQGRSYQFDRVCPPECREDVDQEERYVAPGLVYQECRVPSETFAQ
ncbi:hypothetical protein [Noviherbaspirillum aridicola]|uniref:Uncharacterized protein n=1 Tax=Noviherbaspirillum aridicola TaxID=2849687 RepID=A0ABQ4Q271_9BURK|nr:hypothetical protein [Noviherbaspirillum aridicola]GIZ51204.1 hypothetical protein NCCP691_12180 [Noviherbaspirillum aridicola]